MRADIWSEEDIELLRKVWPTSFAIDIEDLFGRSADCINHKARRMGLKKVPPYNRYSRYGVHTKKGNHFNKEKQ